MSKAIIFCIFFVVVNVSTSFSIRKNEYFVGNNELSEKQYRVSYTHKVEIFINDKHSDENTFVENCDDEKNINKNIESNAKKNDADENNVNKNQGGDKNKFAKNDKNAENGKKNSKKDDSDDDDDYDDYRRYN